MRVLKRLTTSRRFQKVLGVTAAEYLRFVSKTNKLIIEPADIYDIAGPHLPAIITMWHGQHFMAPFLRRPEHKVAVLISRHRDGEINAVAAEWLGIKTIRGSGAHDNQFDRKGGVGAFRLMVDALTQNTNIVMTADVPKVARRAGLGIVTLARYSGRPILPVAVTTSRRIELDTWDRSEVSLPLGRFGVVVRDPIYVAAAASDAELDQARQHVETELNQATTRVRALVARSQQS